VNVKTFRVLVAACAGSIETDLRLAEGGALDLQAELRLWKRETDSPSAEAEVEEIIAQLSAPLLVADVPAMPRPARDAPVDTWLDWREAEIAAGRKASFTQLAK
jgi:hypothetical protein